MREHRRFEFSRHLHQMSPPGMLFFHKLSTLPCATQSSKLWSLGYPDLLSSDKTANSGLTEHHDHKSLCQHHCSYTGVNS